MFKSGRSILMNAGAIGLVPAGTARRCAIAEHESAEREVEELPRITEADLERARSEGRAEAEEAFNKKLEELRAAGMAQWKASAVHFDDFIKRMKVEIADQLVKTSIRIAEIIIRHQLPDREMICDVIRQVLDPVSDLQGARIRMNPQDAAMIIEMRTRGSAPAQLSDAVEIVADASLARGDLMIESRNGLFDARLQERIRLLEERIARRTGSIDAD